MTIREKHEKRHLRFHTVLAFTILAVIFTTALTAAGLSGDQTGKHKFELRLASYQKVKGWESVPGPGPENAPVWISPEVALTNRDVARAYPSRTLDGKPCVGVLLTEDGALKFARLTKSHIGEFLAVILDGRVTIAPKIRQEITGGEVMILGNFTEKETGSIASGLSGIQIQIREPEVEPRKLNLELRLASHEKVEGWDRVPGPEPQNIPLWISPEVALSNRDIARAYVDRTSEGKPGVGIILTEEGALKLARLTKRHFGENVAIILDGRIQSAPKIMDEITGGRAIIHGQFTEESAGLVAKGIMMK
jgi:preprotein translocase subunit SecD